MPFQKIHFLIFAMLRICARAVPLFYTARAIFYTARKYVLQCKNLQCFGCVQPHLGAVFFCFTDCSSFIHHINMITGNAFYQLGVTGCRFLILKTYFLITCDEKHHRRTFISEGSYRRQFYESRLSAAKTWSCERHDHVLLHV